MSADLQRFVLFVIASGVIALAPPCLLAQEEPRIVEVRITTKDNKAELKPLDLRPNTATAVGIALKNDLDEKLSDVTAKLVQVVGDKKYRLLAEASLKELKAGDKANLKFEKVKDGPKDGDLVGQPPYKIQLHVDAAKAVGFEAFKRDLDLSIDAPSKYITPKKADFVDRAGNKRLRFLVEDNLKIAGPHQCPVQIVLGPELEQTKKGVLKQTLDESGQEIELFADALAFAGKFTKGRVYLKVDDYDRAFTYDVTLSGEGAATPVPFATKIGANIRIPRYMKPSENFVVPLELDGTLSDDYRVEVAIDRAGEQKRFQALKPMVGLRQMKVWIAVAPANHLIVQTKVSDWQPQFDTAGTTGAMWLRLQVFNVARINPKTNKPSAASLDVTADAPPSQARMEYDEVSKILYARVIQDDSAAEDIAFINVPKEWEVGKPLPLKVTVRPRDETQAPIEKVVLFKGKAPKEKEDVKLDDILAKIDVADEKKWAWSFTLPAQDKAETMLLSVQFTTATGVKSVKTEAITFKPAAAAGTNKTLATIKGVLQYGDEPQPKQKVLLLDAKRKTLDTVETGPKGEFVFKKVPPGAYVIWSSPRFGTDVLVGAKEIEVKEGDEKIDAKTLSVLLK